MIENLCQLLMIIIFNKFCRLARKGSVVRILRLTDVNSAHTQKLNTEPVVRILPVNQLLFYAFYRNIVGDHVK